MLPLQILVISLPHSKDRQHKVSEEMAKTRLEWSFIDAVDGRKIDMATVPYHAMKVKRMQGFSLTPGEIGCYLSHTKCWQACVDKNLPTLVCEDDFLPLPHFESALMTLLQDYRDWQLVRMQGLHPTPDESLSDFGSYRLVKNFADPIGGTAYLVTPQAAQTLLQHSTEIYEPVDHYLEHQEKHGLTMLAIKPYPVTEMDPVAFSSTITDRPGRPSLRGWKKVARSFYRLLDRHFSHNPYFPK